MRQISTIGFIGGGLMGEALIKGLINKNVTTADRIFVAEPVQERRDTLEGQYGIRVFESGEHVFQGCDIVILAVKPQVMMKVLKQNRAFVSARHLVISIAAGVTLAQIETALDGSGCRVVRVMPNTPAIVQQCAAALSPGSRATDDDLERAKAIFDAIGTSVIVDETLLDAVTGLSGSGPAYVFTFIEAFVDAGVVCGLPRQTAFELVVKTVLGSTLLTIESGKHPASLRDMVTSPGGTTIAGMHALEKGNFRASIMDAVKAATDRSIELGKSAMSPR